MLVDFVGGVRHRPDHLPLSRRRRTAVRLIDDEVAAERSLLGDRAARIAGVGLAMPFELWSWAEEIGAPEAEIDAWRGADLRAVLAAELPWPVYIQNDATAACGAELAFGDDARDCRISSTSTSAPSSAAAWC